MSKRAAVITVSDRSFRGEREDLSGPAVALALREAGFESVGVELVPDDSEMIQAALLRHASHAALVVTTGGTGVATRDVTPEATIAVCERMVPGIVEYMRAEGLKTTSLAPLSRAVCGIHGATLILNLPGNPKGAVESLQFQPAPATRRGSFHRRRRS
jgi:molybdopterin adenylyltransferase